MSCTFYVGLTESGLDGAAPGAVTMIHSACDHWTLDTGDGLTEWRKLSSGIEHGGEIINLWCVCCSSEAQANDVYVWLEWINVAGPWLAGEIVEALDQSPGNPALSDLFSGGTVPWVMAGQSPLIADAWDPNREDDDGL